MELPSRIKRRISRDYPQGDQKAVEEILLDLMEYLENRGADTERILAATLLDAEGQTDQLLSAVQLARIDFRDILMGSGLEHADWRDRLDSEFGT
jgi:molecular chaperone GrpE (heat shock protein)